MRIHVRYRFYKKTRASKLDEDLRDASRGIYGFHPRLFMVSVVELVDTPDCDSGAAALRVQVSSIKTSRRKYGII